MTAPASTPTLDLATSTVAQIAVNVHDLDRAVRFYRDTLGLPFLFQFPGLAFFRSGDVRFMLNQAEKPEFDHPGSFIYFKVSEIEAAHQMLSARGVRFVDQPHVVHRAPTYELWMVFFHDSEENPYALMEERPVS